MDLEPLTLPAGAAAPRKQPVPVLAAVVPIAAGVVLWLVTGSIFSLCFAALGPLMIGASLLDGLRTKRRDRRTAAEDETAGWRRAEQELRRRHQRERRELRRVHPDAAASIQDPPLRDLQSVDDTTPLVIGAGSQRSALRVTGDESERARTFRERAANVTDVPIVVAMRRGVCFRGPTPIASAAARALIVQLCLRHAPAQLALVGNGLEPLGLNGFPHAGRPRRGAWRLAVVLGEGDDADASAQVRVCGVGGDVPEGVTTVVDCTGPAHARLRTGAGVEEIAMECLSRAQAVAIASSSVEREGDVAQLPDSVALADLMMTSVDDAQGLRAAIGRTESADVILDLVEDGPHAIVTGMTGSGKSELLVTWIAAMARSHGPEEVAFVLADFKGGTAFDPLRALPHVAAVMTDLDEEGARRGVQSLTAELRRREAVLAELGARNIAEAHGQLPRLVIVVDEFAALLQEHPDLGAVFTDIAARGRALGMHLILGTQRAAGVIRDALAANCPLRVSLRVTEAADSRLVIGSDHAAELPGGSGSRGLAFVRRPQDSEAVAVRIALAGAADLRGAAARWESAAEPASPWLPSLPAQLTLDELRNGTVPDGSLFLGLVDEPERQRQTPRMLRPGIDRGIAVIGGSGSGRSSVLRALAAQSDRYVLIPADPERAWDAVAELAEGGQGSADLVLCDDLDQLTASFPVEHAQVFIDRFEKLVRSAAVRGCTVVVTTGRASGQNARVVDALPTRMFLRMGTKMEHLAAGGDNDGYRRDRPAGRARIDELELQIAWSPDAATALSTDASDTATRTWTPAAALVGVIAPGVRRVVECLRGAFPEYVVVPVSDRSPDPAALPQQGSAVSLSSRPVPTILVGDAESWQRQFAQWQRIRVEGEMLILAECQSELRSLAGWRELPPYAETHMGRAWALHDGASPQRVIVPGLNGR
ncbi:FtsK/SpoIIIE domain-containing protein [Microbacterium sp. A93]|uniref:FtsK/SpoIIIE domain-containing protein n=1 Tax=unclassified Microbacterium TaxID=2609290 RepID=UPI003F42FC7D